MVFVFEILILGIIAILLFAFQWMTDIGFLLLGIVLVIFCLMRALVAYAKISDELDLKKYKVSRSDVLSHYPEEKLSDKQIVDLIFTYVKGSEEFLTVLCKELIIKKREVFEKIGLEIYAFVKIADEKNCFYLAKNFLRDFWKEYNIDLTLLMRKSNDLYPKTKLKDLHEYEENLCNEKIPKYSWTSFKGIKKRTEKLSKEAKKEFSGFVLAYISGAMGAFFIFGHMIPYIFG